MFVIVHNTVKTRHSTPSELCYNNVDLLQDTHQDWNGVSGPGPGPGAGTSDNSLSAQETEPNCDPKDNSASSDAGDPVAKAIEQRSYR